MKTEEETEQPFRQGMLITPVSKLEFTGEYHTLIMKYEPTEIFTEIMNIKRAIDTLCVEVKKQSKLPTDFHRRFSQVTDSMYRDLGTMQTDYTEFVMSITSSVEIRRKRGIFAMAAVASSILVGLGSIFRTSKLQARINALEELEEEELLILKHHTTEIDILKANMSFTMENQEVLSKAMKYMMGILGQLETTTDVVIMEVNILLNLEMWNNVLGRLRNHLRVVQMAMLRMFDGKLDSHFLNPTQLLNILIQLSLKHNLIFPALEEFLYAYYKLAGVIVTQGKGTLVIFVEIPLKSIDSQFTLYHLQPIPIPVPITHLSKSGPKQQLFAIKHIHIDYLAVADNRKWFAPMPTLDHCHSIIDLHVCEPLTSFISAEAENCEVAAFLDREESKTWCSTHILKNVAPMFLKQQDNWFYAVPDSLQLTLKCRKGSTTFAPMQRLQGIGTIQLPPGCEGHALGVYLPSQWHSSENLKLRKERITVDANTTILSEEDHARLRTLELPSILNHLRNTTSGSISLNELQKLETMRRTLDRHEGAGRQLEYMSYGALAAIILFACIHMAAYCVACRQGKSLRRHSKDRMTLHRGGRDTTVIE